MEPKPDKSKWTVEVFDSIEELKAAEDAENAAQEVTPEMRAAAEATYRQLRAAATKGLRRRTPES